MVKKISALFSLLNAWLPPLIWAGVIFFLSNQSDLPQFEASGLEFFSKKLAHLTVYAILYLLFSRAWQLKSPRSLKKHSLSLWLVPIILCLIYATSDEIHQSFVAGRYATIRDVGFDMLGVATAFFWQYGYI